MSDIKTGDKVWLLVKYLGREQRPFLPSALGDKMVTFSTGRSVWTLPDDEVEMCEVEYQMEEMMRKPPENYDGIDRRGYGVPVADSKPIGMKKGMCVDVLVLYGDEGDVETLELARESAVKGNSVLVGTEDVVGRFLWPGAMEEEE